jgi:hypothetical protein
VFALAASGRHSTGDMKAKWLTENLKLASCSETLPELACRLLYGFG